MRRIGKLICVYVFSMCTSAFSVTTTDKLAMSDLVAGIQKAETAIHDIQANISCRIPQNKDPRFSDVNWGYKRGMEYNYGTDYTSANETVPLTPVEVNIAFDGKSMTIFRRNQSGIMTGRITSFETQNFKGRPSINTFLGHNIRWEGRQTLGEVLSQMIAEKKTVNLRPPEIINGRACIPIECLGVESYPDGRTYDAVVWIDPDQGFRPLQVEHYYSYEGKNRFKALIYREKTEKLIEVTPGIWIPVKGTRQGFTLKYDIPQGMTPADLKKVPREQFMSVVDIKLEPGSPYEMTVDESSIKVNQGIPLEKFRVKYPVGTSILDDFTGITYIVGGSNSVDAIDTNSKNQKPPGATVPSDGKNNVKTNFYSDENSTSRPQNRSTQPFGNSVYSYLSNYKLWCLTVGCILILFIGWVILKKRKASL